VKTIAIAGSAGLRKTGYATLAPPTAPIMRDGPAVTAQIVTACGRERTLPVRCDAERAHLRHSGSVTLSSAARIERCGVRANEWRGTCGRGHRDLGGQPEMPQDLLDGWGVVDQGDQAQAPVAARAGSTRRGRERRGFRQPRTPRRRQIVRRAGRPPARSCAEKNPFIKNGTDRGRTHGFVRSHMAAPAVAAALAA